MNKKHIIASVVAIVASALVLFICAGALSKMAEENAQKELNAMMATLLPDSTSFVAEEFDATVHTGLKAVYKGETGFIIESSAYGYAGDITLLVAVNNDGSVNGLVVRDLSETYGLGARALTDTAFLEQFLGTSGEAEVGNNVDALTGATVSSKAVTKAVNSAVAYVTGADVSSSATEWGG